MHEGFASVLDPFCSNLLQIEQKFGPLRDWVQEQDQIIFVSQFWPPFRKQFGSRIGANRKKNSIFYGFGNRKFRIDF